MVVEDDYCCGLIVFQSGEGKLILKDLRQSSSFSDNTCMSLKTSTGALHPAMGLQSCACDSDKILVFRGDVQFL